MTSQKLTNLKTYAADWLYLHRLPLIIGLALGFLAGSAIAETVPLQWTNPTQYVNGAPLPAADLLETQIECKTFTPNGSTTAQPCAAGTKAAPAPAATYDFDVGTVPPSGGVYAFVARSKVKSGAVSADTSQATKLFAAVLPRSPTGFSVVATTAHEVKLRPNGQFDLGRAVGFVAVGTSCSPDFALGEFRKVPRDAVRFEKRTRSAVIVARCAAT